MNTRCNDRYNRCSNDRSNILPRIHAVTIIPTDRRYVKSDVIMTQSNKQRWICMYWLTQQVRVVSHQLSNHAPNTLCAARSRTASQWLLYHTHHIITSDWLTKLRLYRTLSVIGVGVIEQVSWRIYGRHEAPAAKISRGGGVFHKAGNI